MEGKTYLAVRVGICDDLEKMLLNYSKEFKIWPEGDPAVKKFFRIEQKNGETNYTMISDTEGGVVSQIDYYNITVTVWGNNRDKITEKMGDLEKNLGIELKRAPDILILKYRIFFGLKEENLT